MKKNNNITAERIDKQTKFERFYKKKHLEAYLRRSGRNSERMLYNCRNE